MVSKHKRNTPSFQKQLHYIHEQGRLLFAMPEDMCRCALQLPFVFKVYYDIQRRKTVITRRVDRIATPARKKIEVEFVDFTEREIDAVVEVIEKGGVG